MTDTKMSKLANQSKKNDQVKELLDHALDERQEMWMAILHGGEEDTPMLGFPTLDEVDIKTVHEAYQFLSSQYVDEVMKATSTFQLLHRSFMNIARPKIDKPRVDLFVEG